ncbi:MAG: hypothetical protein J2P24_16930 [Streptosporangiales bacterium]|nr:hypothetical protein [Streptosporangiales bacterium]MBO0892388.1 hypothetical protein [Acidothermales bacterium]
MDTVRNPSGPLPPSTYWRRRVVLIGVLLLVVVGIAWACARNSGAEQPTGAVGSPSGLPTVPSDTASPTPTPTPTASGSATPTGSATTPAPGPTSPKPSMRNGKVLCPASDLRVTVRADRKFYSSKQQPKFTLILVNVHKTSCYVDLGSKAIGVTVYSGSDRVWSTTDCAKGPGSQLHKLPSGGVYTANATWNRVRSVRGCAKTTVTAKPGYYVLDGTVDAAKPNDRTVFVLQKN